VVAALVIRTARKSVEIPAEAAEAEASPGGELLAGRAA
jgi:hypothetical protein